MWGPEMRSGWSRNPTMISPFEMYFASTPVIAMKPTGCLRFPECPRAGGSGRPLCFKRPKAGMRPNLDVARCDAPDPLLPSLRGCLPAAGPTDYIDNWHGDGFRP